MILRALLFIRLPIVLIVIWTVMRFLMGTAFNQPYAPRGNAVFSIINLTVISAIYYGALSKRIGHFSWIGTILIGVLIAEVAQVMIFSATGLSFMLGRTTYFTHWDALNLPEGTVPTMGQAMGIRAMAFIFAPISGIVTVVVGRLLAGLAPGAKAGAAAE
ncbi:MAG TPA: hypothetical protein PLF26_09770 [Blastocatellia bacterium]|nr:hypothetical protein [Blastocatellia bacterium]